MPFDPQKQIEDLLKASARERREKFGAEPKMPGPMRTQLQAEIARMNERATPSEGVGWFYQWWPRLAIAAVVTLLVSLPLYRELSRQKPALATAERSARDESMSSAEIPAVNEPAGIERDAKLAFGIPLEKERQPAGAVASGALDGRKAGEAEDRLAFGDSVEKQHDSKPASVPAVVAQPVQSEMAAGNGRPAMQKFANIQLQDKDAAAASKAAIAQNTIGEQSNLKRQLANSPLRQEFRANLKVKQAVDVLSSFQFEQTGNSIRIYDADGSMYSGEIHPVAAKDSGGRDHSARGAGYGAGSKAESVGKEKAGGLAEANGFYFRAEGANRSLNKSVVIEGNYIQQQPQSVSAPASRPMVGGAVQTQSPQAGARIVGRAQINGRTEVEIDAVSVPPR